MAAKQTAAAAKKATKTTAAKASAPRKRAAPPKKKGGAKAAAPPRGLRVGMSFAVKMWRTWIDRAFKSCPARPHAPLDAVVLARGSKNAYVSFFSVGQGFSAKKLAAKERIVFERSATDIRERAAFDYRKSDDLALDADGLLALGEAMKTLASYRDIATGKVKSLSFAPELTLLHGTWVEELSPYNPPEAYRVVFLGEWALYGDVTSITVPSAIR